MSLPTEFPETHAELYDLLHREFGIGSYDELIASPPWFQARMAEIGKLKTLCRSRRATTRQVAIAAWYAKDTRRAIYQAVNLFPLIPEAMRAFNTAKAQQAEAASEVALTEAIDEAIEAGQLEWAERLMRATPDNARSQIEEWRSSTCR